MFSIQVQAQYQTPSPERVTELLQQIGDCKTQITKTEDRIKTIEANADSYTLAEYNTAKEFLERLNTCLNMSRGELDSIRKEYPGWFNAPNTVMQLGKGHEITPRSLQEQLNAIEEKIKKVIASFEALDKPKD